MNGNCTKEDLEGKYVFWDIDGTLAPYRFNNHVADPEGTNNGMSLKEIDEHIFLLRKPSRHMRNIVYTCRAKKNIIMGHCQIQQERDDKQKWLDRYFPIIERPDRLLTFEDVSKADSIIGYCKLHGIDLKDVVFVDDVIPFLREAERKGITSYHISSFLDWDYGNNKGKKTTVTKAKKLIPKINICLEVMNVLQKSEKEAFYRDSCKMCKKLLEQYKIFFGRKIEAVGEYIVVHKLHTITKKTGVKEF